VFCSFTQVGFDFPHRSDAIYVPFQPESDSDSEKKRYKQQRTAYSWIDQYKRYHQQARTRIVEKIPKVELSYTPLLAAAGDESEDEMLISALFFLNLDNALQSKLQIHVNRMRPIYSFCPVVFFLFFFLVGFFR
jgi:hypothetical protein